MNLFNFYSHCHHKIGHGYGRSSVNEGNLHGPRVASPDEVEAYVNWLAMKRGVSADSIVLESVADAPVEVELLDDAGNVSDSFTLGTKNGKIAGTAKKFRERCGLVAKPVRKPSQLAKLKTNLAAAEKENAQL